MIIVKWLILFYLCNVISKCINEIKKWGGKRYNRFYLYWNINVFSRNFILFLKLDSSNIKDNVNR